jgi:protein phosphatase
MQAHGRIYAPWLPRAARTGATFAGVVDCGESFAVGHVGDSRAYLLRASKGRLAQLTADHTVAIDAHRRGAHRDAALLLPDAHNLTQAIGVRYAATLETGLRRWEPGDTVLLCTDGLSDHLDSESIANILFDGPDLGKAADRLVDRAIEVGGSDNATVVLVHRTT